MFVNIVVAMFCKYLFRNELKTTFLFFFRIRDWQLSKDFLL